MSFFAQLAELFKSPAPPDPAVQAAFAQVVQWVDPLVRAAPHLEKHLFDAVEHALGYCQDIVSALPGPLAVNRQSFSQDPLIHALFATPSDIQEMLGRSEAVRDFLERVDSWQEPEFYALLAARRQQKKQFGMAQQGDIIRNDVPQNVLYFSDQTLVEPHCDLVQTRERLRCRALESLLRTFNEHIEQLRQDRESLRTDISVENALLQMQKSRAHFSPEDGYARHLDELTQRLRENGALLAPENLVEQLADFLRRPESALHLTPVSYCINRLGIIQTPESAELDAQQIHFSEFSTRDRRQHLAALVRISRAEAQQAVDAARQHNIRRILI
ncbi:hypothetical protein [Azonexus sp.]|uniref:hypothetical protein n=1 Tax=Azonexus sp. TaxID=1872668 RepID=UPI0039E3F6EA